MFADVRLSVWFFCALSIIALIKYGQHRPMSDVWLYCESSGKALAHNRQNRNDQDKGIMQWERWLSVIEGLLVPLALQISPWIIMIKTMNKPLSNYNLKCRFP